MSKVTGFLFVLTGLGIIGYGAIVTPTAHEDLLVASSPASSAEKRTAGLASTTLSSERVATTSIAVISPAAAAGRSNRTTARTTQLASNEQSNSRSFSAGRPLLQERPTAISPKQGWSAKTPTTTIDKAQRQEPGKSAVKSTPAAAKAVAETDKTSSNRFMVALPDALVRFVKRLRSGVQTTDTADAATTAKDNKTASPAAPNHVAALSPNAALGPNIVRTIRPKLISAAVKTDSTEIVAAPNRFAKTKPVGDDQLNKLARDLQQELRRIGCYEGSIDGKWGPGSQQAMKAFTRSVNATLPIDKPDFILLTLVQGHTAKACGSPCALGQIPSHNGSCISPAILAQSKPPARTKTAKGAVTQKKSRTAASSATTKAKPGKTAVRRRWATSTTVKPKPRKSVITPELLAARRLALKRAARNRRLNPLPGRMAIRGPVQRRHKTAAATNKTNGTKTSGSKTAKHSKTNNWTTRVDSFLADRDSRTAARRRAKSGNIAPVARAAPVRVSGPIIRTPSIVPQSSAADIPVAKSVNHFGSTRIVAAPTNRVTGRDNKQNREQLRASGEEDSDKTDEQLLRQQRRQAAAAKRKRRAIAQHKRTANARKRYQRKSYLGAQQRKSRPRKHRRRKWKRRIFSDTSQSGS